MRKPRVSKRRFKKQLKRGLLKMLHEHPDRFHKLVAMFDIQLERKPALKESSDGC
jgi:hypothetical protein